MQETKEAQLKDEYKEINENKLPKDMKILNNEQYSKTRRRYNKRIKITSYLWAQVYSKNQIRKD